MLEQARAELAPTGVLRAGIKMKASGFVARLIEKHGVTDRLTVAPPA